MKWKEIGICYGIYVVLATVIGVSVTMTRVASVVSMGNNGTLGNSTCLVWKECGWNGVCMRNNETGTEECVCGEGFITVRDGVAGVPDVWRGPCAYPLVSNVNAFLASFLGGGYGADWFLLSRGGGPYVAGGVFKIITLGGVGVWWITDWCRVLTNSFPDGYGYPLLDAMHTGHNGTLP